MAEVTLEYFKKRMGETDNYPTTSVNPSESEPNGGVTLEYFKKRMGETTNSRQNKQSVGTSAQPTQAAPVSAPNTSVQKPSDTMKKNLGTIKVQKNDALSKASAYMRAGNMVHQAKDAQKEANRLSVAYENANSAYKTQRNMEDLADYNPDDNHFKAADAVISGVENWGQSTQQSLAAASAYAGDAYTAREKAYEAKKLMDAGMNGVEAQKQVGLTLDKDVPATDYKTKSELRHEMNVESVGTGEAVALNLINTVANMAPSIVANFFIPGIGLPLMSASAAGNKYSEALEKYDDPTKAFVLGTGAGLASMATEQLGGVYGSMGETALGKAAAKKLMAEAPSLYAVAESVGGKWLRDVISEGIEEGAEDIINYAIEKSLTGDSDEMDNIGYDMLLGALAGGVLGGANAVSRATNYNRLGKAVKASDETVRQEIESGLEKGEGTAPNILAKAAQENPSAQIIGRLYEANKTFSAEDGLSKLASGDITRISVKQMKDMVNDAKTLYEAAKKLGVPASQQAVHDAIVEQQKQEAVRTAENAVSSVFNASIDNPVNAGEEAYNAALNGVAANQGNAFQINSNPDAKQSFANLTGANFNGIPAHDIAEIEVRTRELANSGKQAIPQAEYDARVSAAAEQAQADYDADYAAQAQQMQDESVSRYLSAMQNTIIDVDGKRHLKEITNTDRIGSTEVSYKAAEIPNSKKAYVSIVNKTAKYLGKTVVWYEGALQVNGQYRLANGFRAPNGTIYLNINAENPIVSVFGHEMFHDLVSNEKYKPMIDTLLSNEEYAEMVNGTIEAKINLYERNGIELRPEEASEEAAADISGEILNTPEMLEYIGARSAEAANGINGFLTRTINKLKGKPSAQEAYDMLSESQKALIDGMEGRTESTISDTANEKFSIMDSGLDSEGRELPPGQREYFKYIKENAISSSDMAKIVGSGDVGIALPNGYKDIGIAIIGEDSAAPNRYSLMSFGESELGTDKLKYAIRLSEAIGVPAKKAMEWIDSVYSVAAIIGESRERLDYVGNRNNTSLKPNMEYDFSLDFSTLCPKRLLFSGTLDAIQSALPNTPLTSDDYVHIRELMKNAGYEVACGICYVESTRREYSTISEGFVDQYKKAMADGTNIKRVNSKGEIKDLITSKGIENTDPKRFVYPEDGYVPTLADLVTADGIDRLQKEHPNVYMAFNAYMNARGQQKPKMVETRTDYRGETLNMTKGQIKRRNSRGGLRIQSFSDFEIVHLIDMMQAVYDMSIVGLKGQAYTKMPEFARAFGQTGIKINLSLIAKGDGVDENGKLIFDDVEGMPASEAFAIRGDTRFSDNVGTILVGKNVKHIVTAMADPRIDFIIPFHKSNWALSLYKSLGLEGYEDFTNYQNEKKPGKDIDNYDPSEYWDFSKSGDENAKIYLEKCKEDGRIPKFAEVMYNGKSLTEYPGYWKLLIDFKMYNNDGIGAKQEPVKPIFDDGFNASILNEYNSNHRDLPVANEIVEKFLKEKGIGDFSLQDIVEMSLNGNSIGDLSLMEDDQYKADIEKAVADAIARSETDLKASQDEINNLRKQLSDLKNQAKKDAKANDRWRDAEAKLIADIAAAKEREKASKEKSDYFKKRKEIIRGERLNAAVRNERSKQRNRLRDADKKSTTTDDVAQVLAEVPKKTAETRKRIFLENWRTFKREWVNTKDELERFGALVGDERIMYAANNLGQASAAAQYSIGGSGQYDLNGKKIGDKNLTQVFAPAKKAGLIGDFYTYLLHEHNIDRMDIRNKAQKQLSEFRQKQNGSVNGFSELTDEDIIAAASNDSVINYSYTQEQQRAAKEFMQFRKWAENQFDKPVFGSSVTADDSRSIADNLLEQHPEFKEWAKDVYAYNDNLMAVRKQAGLVSEDLMRRTKELYPHYVPIFRDMVNTSGGYHSQNSISIDSTIEKAKGGNQNIMPIMDSMARQTMQVFSAAKKNVLGNMLYNDAMSTNKDISEFIQSVDEDGEPLDIYGDVAEKLDNTISIYVDGNPVTLHMSSAMADGFRSIQQSNATGMKLLRSANSIFKKLVTQWNPVFIVRNFVRDAQSALFFTHYSNATFVKNYGRAVKEITSNGKYWQLYQAMGGKGTTYYDPKTGLVDRKHFDNAALEKASEIKNKIVGILSAANESVEQFPRLAEFISTMEATGDVQKALYNAADITTNFGRGGFAARKLNATLVPFFNPGMQGLSKNIRNVIDRKGAKEIGQLISRLLINGVMPGVIMSFLYDGLKEDKEYQELSNYIKDSNILIKVSKNKFIKIPTGREPSVITAFTNRVWRWIGGEPAEKAFAEYPKFAIEQIAPNNPLSNNIFSGIYSMTTNKSWYGGDIVSQYMGERPNYLQYDESTDAFSIWLGEITKHGSGDTNGISPKKANYLIDQYSGFLGDYILPALSKKADIPAFAKAFVVDSVRQNRLSGDFYDALDVAKAVTYEDECTAADSAVYSYLYKQSKAASDITKQLREIYNSESSRQSKMKEATDLLELRNEIYRNALETVSVYESNAKSINSVDAAVVKREANAKTFGYEYALYNINKATGEKAAKYVADGVTWEQYYNAYVATRDLDGGAEKKVAIDKAVSNANQKQKNLLYDAFNVAKKYR